MRTTELKLQAQIFSARRKLDKIRAAQEIRTNRKHVGKCFKYENSYGTGEKWWLYLRVTGGGRQLRGWQFQITSTGRIEANEDKWITGIERYIEIPRSEFDAEWKKFLIAVKKLNQ